MRPETMIVLAGGLGRRLRPAVPDLPKVLAPVSGRPFLAWLLEALAREGVGRCVFSLGHRAEQVTDYLTGHEAERPPGLKIEWAVEPRPLGTGGGVRFAAKSLGLSGPVLIVNGDTFFCGGVAEMVAARESHSHEIALARVTEAARYGWVEVDPNGRVAGFSDKARSGPGWVYAGLCRLPVETLDEPGTEEFSLEKDLLTPLAADGRLYARHLDSEFIDIGVPSDYKRFCDLAVTGFAK